MAHISHTEEKDMNIVGFLSYKILELLPTTLVKFKTNFSFHTNKHRVKGGLSVSITDIKEQTREFDSLVSNIMLILNLKTPGNLFFNIYISPKIYAVRKFTIYLIGH